MEDLNHFVQLINHLLFPLFHWQSFGENWGTRDVRNMALIMKAIYLTSHLPEGFIYRNKIVIYIYCKGISKYRVFA